jgi:hypothetical protein
MNWRQTCPLFQPVLANTIPAEIHQELTMALRCEDGRRHDGSVQ